MSTAIEPKRPNAVDYRKQVERQIEATARGVLIDLVGEDRAREATARLALAMRQAAMAAPKLYEAQPSAIANAIALSALTSLMPGGIFADCWLIPKGGSANGLLWMPSHRGVIKLARRAGWEVDVGHVFEGERFEYHRTPFPSIEHEPDDGVEQSWDTLRSVYLIFWPTGNRAEWRAYVLGKHELEARRASSDNAQGSTWRTWWREMAAKTAIKAAAGRGLLPLDDIGIAALSAEDRTEVIERQIAPKLSGMDDLAAELGEPVPAQADDDILTPAERVREEAKPEGRSGKGGRGKGQRGGDAQPEALPPEAQRVGLIADVKAGLSAIGTDFVGMAYEQAGLQPSRRPEDLTADELTRLAERCRAIADAEGA